MTMPDLAEVSERMAATVPLQRRDDAPPASWFPRCEAYPQPFDRCAGRAEWHVSLDVTDHAGDVRKAWEAVAVCTTHRSAATVTVLAHLASNRAGVLHITPTGEETSS